MSQLFEVRPATDDDVVPLSEFLNACTLVHQGVSRSSPADIVARLHRESADPRLDSFVAVSDDAIVGFAHLWADGPTRSSSSHAPTLTRAAAASAAGSYHSAIGRAAELLPGAQRTTTTWAADASAPALLEAQGYRPIRYFVTMEIGAGSVSEQATVWPAGIERVRLSGRPDLSGALYVAWKEAFAGHWGRQVETEAEFWRERRDAKLGSAFPFEPELWLLASPEARWSASVCASSVRATQSRSVGSPRSASSRRSVGPGLGFALLHDGFRELRGRGATRIVLDVDAENTTSALRLYEGAGMTPRPAFTIWEKGAFAVARVARVAGVLRARPW